MIFCIVGIQAFKKKQREVSKNMIDKKNLGNPIPVRLKKTTVKTLSQKANELGLPLGTYIRLLVEQAQLEKIRA